MILKQRNIRKIKNTDMDNYPYSYLSAQIDIRKKIQVIICIRIYFRPYSHKIYM